MSVIRAFLAFEAVAFAIASLIHRGLLVEGYADPAASTAEGIIAVVLALGLAGTFVVPARSRVIGLVVQAFALVGTSIGLGLVLSGIGPSTVPDVLFHVGIWLVLIVGLVVTARTRT